MEEELSPDQLADVERIVEIVMESTKKDVREMARLMVTQETGQILGQSEFEVRNITHRVGARVVEAAVEVAKKGGTMGRAQLVPTATKRPNFRNTDSKR